jgi:hypothetical protein
MALRAPQEELAATGLAAPPSAATQPVRAALLELDVPAWAATTLTAVGVYRPADGEMSADDARQDAARLDGAAQLWRSAEALRLQPDVTVATYLSYHQDLKGDVTLWLSGVRVTAASRALPGGGVEVRVELPARRLWEILRRKMRVEEVEPEPEAPAGTTRPA